MQMLVGSGSEMVESISHIFEQSEWECERDDLQGGRALQNSCF